MQVCSPSKLEASRHRLIGAFREFADALVADFGEHTETGGLRIPDDTMPADVKDAADTFYAWLKGGTDCFDWVVR